MPSARSAGLEQHLERPVTTANQALLRAAGASAGAVSGYGRLFGQLGSPRA